MPLDICETFYIKFVLTIQNSKNVKCICFIEGQSNDTELSNSTFKKPRSQSIKHFQYLKWFKYLSILITDYAVQLILPFVTLKVIECVIEGYFDCSRH